jgi:hypothetical protein
LLFNKVTQDNNQLNIRILIIFFCIHSVLKSRAMCPLRYLYHILLFLTSNVLLTSCTEWKAFFEPNAVTVKTAAKQRVHLVLSGISDETIANLNDRDYIQLKSENDELAMVRNQDQIKFFEVERSNRSWDAFFDVNGVFLGKFYRNK